MEALLYAPSIIAQRTKENASYTLSRSRIRTIQRRDLGNISFHLRWSLRRDSAAGAKLRIGLLTRGGKALPDEAGLAVDADVGEDKEGPRPCGGTGTA